MPGSRSCIFCDIIAGRSSETIEFSNDNIVIFKDIKPASDFHYLAAPKIHLQNVRSLDASHKDLSECIHIFIDSFVIR